MFNVNKCKQYSDLPSSMSVHEGISRLKPANEVVGSLHSYLFKSSSNIKNHSYSSLLVNFNHCNKGKPIIDNVALCKK
jgi:hypothetical protein